MRMTVLILFVFVLSRLIFIGTWEVKGLANGGMASAVFRRRKGRQVRLSTDEEDQRRRGNTFSGSASVETGETSAEDAKTRENGYTSPEMPSKRFYSLGTSPSPNQEVFPRNRKPSRKERNQCHHRFKYGSPKTCNGRSQEERGYLLRTTSRWEAFSMVWKDFSETTTRRKPSYGWSSLRT